MKKTFCPLTQSECRDDCAFASCDEYNDDRCAYAAALKGIGDVGYALHLVDPEELASAVQFLSVFNDAPMLHDYGSGSVPVFHVGIDWGV